MVDQLTLQTIGVGIAAISVVIGVVNSILSSRRDEKRSVINLETRQAQLFWHAVDKFTSREGLDYMRLIRGVNWSSYEEWLERYRNDAEYKRAYLWFTEIYEGMGVSVRLGHVDIRLVAQYNTKFVLRWWEKYKDVIYERRKMLNDRRYRSEWEYLYNELVKYLEEHPELAP
jgi:hypothetical protein